VVKRSAPWVWFGMYFGPKLSYEALTKRNSGSKTKGPLKNERLIHGSGSLTESSEISQYPEALA